MNEYRRHENVLCQEARCDFQPAPRCEVAGPRGITAAPPSGEGGSLGEHIECSFRGPGACPPVPPSHPDCGSLALSTARPVSTGAGARRPSSFCPPHGSLQAAFLW